MNTLHENESQLHLKAVEVPPQLPLPPWRNPGYVRLDREDFYAAARRCTGLMLIILIYIEDKTRSDPASPPFAEISMDTWRQLTGAHERTIAHALSKAEREGFIEREKPGRHHDRGGYRLRYGHFGDQPLPAPRVRKCKPRDASVRAVEPIAALRAGLQLNAVTHEQPQLTPDAVAPTLTQLTPNAVRLTPDAVQTAKNCQIPGGCPFLINSSSSVLSSTTTGAPAEAVQPTEVDRVQEALQAYGPADPATARRVISRSRQQYPAATVEDILSMVKTKAATLTRNVVSPLAALVTGVPQGFEGFTPPKPKTDPYEEQNIESWWEMIAPDSKYSPEDQEIAKLCLRERGKLP